MLKFLCNGQGTDGSYPGPVTGLVYVSGSVNFIGAFYDNTHTGKTQTYSRLSLSRNRRDPQKQFEMSVLRHIRFVVLRKKQFEQPNFTNDYVI